MRTNDATFLLLGREKKKEEKRMDKLKNFYSTIYFTGIEQSKAGSKRKTGYVWLSNGEITLRGHPEYPRSDPKVKRVESGL